MKRKKAQFVVIKAVGTAEEISNSLCECELILQFLGIKSDEKWNDIVITRWNNPALNCLIGIWVKGGKVDGSGYLYLSLGCLDHRAIVLDANNLESIVKCFEGKNSNL